MTEQRKEEKLGRKVEEEDETTKEERKRKAEKLRRGWELFRICKEMIEEEGGKWKKSQERRDLERKKEEKRQERIARANRKKEEWNRERVQKKITETLNKLPKNRAELCRREDELERRLLIKEAKEEMWRKWRQTKGRRGGAVRYKNDLERKRERAALGHAKMDAEKMRQVQEGVEDKPEEEKLHQEKGEELTEEEKKERRIAAAKRLKESWRNWRESSKEEGETWMRKRKRSIPRQKRQDRRIRPLQ